MSTLKFMEFIFLKRKCLSLYAKYQLDKYVIILIKHFHIPQGKKQSSVVKLFILWSECKLVGL